MNKIKIGLQLMLHSSHRQFAISQLVSLQRLSSARWLTEKVRLRNGWREESKWQVGVSGAHCLVAGFFWITATLSSRRSVMRAGDRCHKTPMQFIYDWREARSRRGEAGNLRCSRSVPSSTLGPGRVGSYPTAASGSYRLLTFDRSCRRRHRPSWSTK